MPNGLFNVEACAQLLREVLQRQECSRVRRRLGGGSGDARRFVRTEIYLTARDAEDEHRGLICTSPEVIDDVAERATGRDARPGRQKSDSG